MKHTTLLAMIAIALCTCARAQTNQKLVLEKATVFIRGAEMVSTAKVVLNKGENEFLFSNVAGSVNSQSIVAGATNGVVVESITFQNNYTNTDNVSPKIKAIKDSMEIIETRKKPIANKIATISEQISILETNRKVLGENTGLSVAELSKLLELVGTKMEAYLNQKDKAENEIAKIDKRIAALNSQLSEEQQRGYQPGGQLLVKFYAKESTTSNISITYIVPNAGWSPTYDIWVDDVKSPVKFFYKANIYQNSGVKWDNIHLTLSTGNPQEGLQAPVLSPMYLAFYAAPSYNGDVVVTQYRKPLVDKYKTSSIMTAEEIRRSPTTQTADIVAMAPGAYQASMNQYVTVDNEGTNTTFDIDLPYTIPSDGQQHLVAVKRYEAPAVYEYYAAPKADKDAFLLAKITNWQDLNLLPGTTNIFYDGTYVGQGTIDTRNLKDTMDISLGRDKKIIIKRERDKTLRSVKTIGTNVREEFAFNITVRNSRKEPVTIVLQDQMPVSNDKDIVIEDVNTSDAEHEEATGMLNWKLTLKGNETKTLHFGYTLKYPKGKTLQ